MPYVFGEYTLDPDHYELRRAGTLVPLEPRVFDLLAYLVQHPGHTITKEVLLTQLWPDQFVAEASLTNAVAQARRALHDAEQPPRYIQTVRGRGYRFIAAVSCPAVSAAPEHVEAPPSVPLLTFIPPQYFLGRDPELAQMAQWFATARQGQRQVGMLAGEAGIGKTALVAAFVAHVASTADVWVGHGQCVDHYGAGEAYLPLLEALGRLCKGPTGTTLVPLLQQYAPSWLAHLPALLLTQDQGHLVTSASDTTPARMLRELTDVLEVLTATRPLVLILEDLHWSDRATLEWLAYAVRRRDPARLLILGTYRPADIMARAHPLRALLANIRPHPQYAELELTYLSEDAVAAYLRQRCEATTRLVGLPQLFHQRTSGHPLFLAAMADEFVRQQLLDTREDAAGSLASLTTLRVLMPKSLRQYIEQHFDQLSTEDQSLLEAASVAGNTFEVAAVEAGTAQPIEVIEAHCTALARHGQFVQAGGTETWPDGTVTACYQFRHALYHEVVYARVSAGHRVRLHQHIGARKAAGYGEYAPTIAAELAMHFLRAQDWHHAVQYLRHAADNAMRRSAYQEAVAYLEQALDALRHLPDSRSTHEQAVDIRFELRNALVPLAVLDRIFDYLVEAETVAAALQDPRRLGRTASYLTHLFWMTGQPDPAIASGQRALALASSVSDFALQIDIHHFLGLAYCTRGDYQQTITYLEKNVAALEGGLQREHFGLSGLPSVNSRAYLLWGLAERGAFAEGSRRAAEALQIAETANHLYSLTIACFGVGFLYLRQGDLSQAIPVLERGLELCESSGLLIRFPSLAATLGYAYTLAGRVTAGLPLLHQAVDKAAATGRIDNQPLWMTWLSEASGLAGRLAEACHLAAHALELARSHQEWGHQAYALWLHGEIAAHHQHDSAGAESYYRQARALAQERGMRPLESHCFRGLGMLYLLAGQREQALLALSTAIDMYRAMGMTFWLPQTEDAFTQAEKLY